MKTINISEASGPALDWLVAKCEGVRTYIGRYEHTMTGPCILDAELVDMHTDGPQELRYSTDWAQGGPIFERERLWLQPELGRDGTGSAWYCVAMTPNAAYGPTALIAAMRCYVASKLGNEVEIPEELV